MQIVNMLCCGWAELYGLQHYKHREFNRVIATAAGMFCKGAYMLACASRIETPKTCGGTRFAKDVESRGLGKVTRLPSFQNPNTRNWIQPFVWQIDPTALYAYCIANRISVHYRYNYRNQ